MKANDLEFNDAVTIFNRKLLSYHETPCKKCGTVDKYKMHTWGNRNKNNRQVINEIFKTVGHNLFFVAECKTCKNTEVVF